jgi:tetratricopeptide (TPR) repeat protein
VDAGRPATGLRLATLALAGLERDELPQERAAALRARILITMADAKVELGHTTEASDLLDEALATAPASSPAVEASRAVLLARTGRLEESRRHFDAALQDFSLAQKPRADHVRTLIWRGMLNLLEVRVPQAKHDTEAARRLAADLGLTDGVAIATHNLGLVRWVAGDLPGALADMAAADEMAPTVRSGVRALDRARLLLAAGLLAEAREFTLRAERIFTAERSRVDLADVLLMQAEIDLSTRAPDTALAAARRAARSYAAAGHAHGVLAARVMQARAQASFRPQRRSAGLPPQHPELTERLVTELLSAGLADDARMVRLLHAKVLLDAGAVAEAQAAVDRAHDPGAPDGQQRQRIPPIAIELQDRVVRARLDFARGRRTSGFAEIRRGLDDLARYQARFGSQDLQSASAVHGGELTILGLRAALETRSPAIILQWLERSRAASTRLAAVRPPADSVLADDLSRLRVASYRARDALRAGEPDPDLERQVDRLRRRVRSRSWTAGGSGAVDAPMTLAAVQRALRDLGGNVTVVAPFRGSGRFHALVITASAAHYRELEADFGLAPLLQRILGDLSLLADHRVIGSIRRVAVASLRTGLDRVAGAIVEPLQRFADDGPVIIAAAGSAAIVPWALLPGLAGRAVSVSPSVTAAVAGMGGNGSAHRGGVLAVAGPEVPHGHREAEAVADVYRAHAATALLTGPAATGAAVLGAIPVDGLVHIAAHGQHEPDNPLFSGVLLADGLLYGYDLAPNPQLPAQVVLSSCDVGRTDDRPGSEPLGLVAALLRTGVRTVVAGTSKVSDEIAAAVMAGYHQRLSSGGRPATALADAITAVSDRRSDPAPFTCFGAGL